MTTDRAMSRALDAARASLAPEHVAALTEAVAGYVPQPGRTVNRSDEQGESVAQGDDFWLAAHQALEHMDDFARMDAGVAPLGPYAVLRDVLTKAKGWEASLAACRADAERWQRWLPWLRRQRRIPFDLAKELAAAIDTMRQETT